MAEWIEQGKKAPAFSLADDAGNKVKLSQFAGSPVILYFYPKDDTPGCTREACAFRDRKAELKQEGAVVLGVSSDDVASHAKFRDKYELNFPLLADTDHNVAEKYGAWREKSPKSGNAFPSMATTTKSCKPSVNSKAETHRRSTLRVEFPTPE